ncbi:Putative HTH-type transcriptional regulator ywnA [Chlamydia abortus]|uniref:Rrf2 family transcriptional regulator n=1 Tax=unclassified Paenibacillus TaxID=185978 RepID=UPI000A27BC72|nr:MULTISPECIES: Rrf2 family transcriptional regulator [Paenibacillaceae]SHE13288.1 Putative HTH-type transcriptional regulator ywnA [Chlamydia abortus]
MFSNSQFAVAVHMLVFIARGQFDQVTSEEMAESVNTNPVVIRRILCRLARGNLVISQPGALGGTKLSRPADQITLLDVYHVIEGCEAYCLHKSQPSETCVVGRNMLPVLEGIMQEAEAAVKEKLSRYTIEDVLRQVLKL